MTAYFGAGIFQKSVSGGQISSNIIMIR